MSATTEQPDLPARRPRVVVAGASGFVGRALLPSLRERWEVVALGRRVADGEQRDGVLWRRCDLFALREVERALEGAAAGVYLVHSMLPSARLTQGRFEDLDLVLADNFGRAAAAAGLERIVYLGGLVPEGQALSRHLRSRLEVERALGAHGVPVTALRAGLVVGAGGSSLRILVKLVERLPVMLCPRWTRSPTQPIDADDVVALLCRALEDPEARGRVCEVGGPDVMSYRELMAETARVLGLRRFFLPVPFFSPGLSRLWVSLVTGTPRALVAPLIQSLRHPMVARSLWLQELAGRVGKPFEVSLRQALSAPAPRPMALRAAPHPEVPTVRSVQRLPLPPGYDAIRVAHAYASWLPRFLRPLLQVAFDGSHCRFGLRGLRRPLLELTLERERSTPDRAVFQVSGGLLVGAPAERAGRLEFRITPDGRHVLAGVHDFRPRLPWWLYRIGQAPFHRFVMWGFGRRLARIASRLSAPPALSADATSSSNRAG